MWVSAPELLCQWPAGALQIGSQWNEDSQAGAEAAAAPAAAALWLPGCLTGFISGSHIAYSYNDSRLN